MGKIVSVLLIFCFIFVGCSSKPISDNKSQNQKYSFGPRVNENEVTKETKEKLQEYINKLGSPEEDNISFHGISAKFTDDGSLEVVMFVRNGYKKAVWDIKSDIQIKKDNNIIASANFMFTKEEFGVLEKNESRVWTIVYKPEFIKNSNVDLSEYVLEYTSEYKQ